MPPVKASKKRSKKSGKVSDGKTPKMKKSKKGSSKGGAKLPAARKLGGSRRESSSSSVLSGPPLANFSEVRVTLPIHLHPSRLGNIEQGIEEQLNQYLMQWVPELQGVPVVYWRQQVAQPTGSIFAGRPHIHFNVNVKFLVFTPKEGSHLEGIVNRVGADHMGLLVHGVFNVAVSAKNGLAERYEYDDDAEVWESKDEGDAQPDANMSVGTRVRIFVTSMQTSDDYFSIKGSVRREDCGAVATAADVQVEKAEKVKAKAETKVSKKEVVTAAASGVNGSVLGNGDSRKSKKKSKKNGKRVREAGSTPNKKSKKKAKKLQA